MRNRTPDSSTPSSLPLPSAEFPICPLPGEPSESDSWVWFVTEKGLRASGATTMKAVAANLRRTAAELEKAAERLDQQVSLGPPSGGRPAPSNGSGATTTPLIFRRLTVCGQYQKEHRVPALRLSGKWMRQAGFDLGQKVQVQVDDRRLTICAE